MRRNVNDSQMQFTVVSSELSGELLTEPVLETYPCRIANRPQSKGIAQLHKSLRTNRQDHGYS
jgi:hypothetical protein